MVLVIMTLAHHYSAMWLHTLTNRSWVEAELIFRSICVHASLSQSPSLFVCWLSVDLITVHANWYNWNKRTVNVHSCITVKHNYWEMCTCAMFWAQFFTVQRWCPIVMFLLVWCGVVCSKTWWFEWYGVVWCVFIFFCLRSSRCASFIQCLLIQV